MRRIFFGIFWLKAVYKIRNNRPNRHRVLLDHFFKHWKYDWAAKKCPYRAHSENDHVTKLWRKNREDASATMVEKEEM